MMSREQMERAFNLWLDDSLNRPERFEAMTKTAMDHIARKNRGEPVTYGQRCATVLEEYAKQSG